MSCRYTAQGEFLCQNPTQNNNVIEHFYAKAPTPTGPPRIIPDSYMQSCSGCVTMRDTTRGFTNVKCSSCKKKDNTQKINPGGFTDIEGCRGKINKAKNEYKSVINDDGRLSCQ